MLKEKVLLVEKNIYVYIEYMHTDTTVYGYDGVRMSIFGFERESKCALLCMSMRKCLYELELEVHVKRNKMTDLKRKSFGYKSFSWY